MELLDLDSNSILSKLQEIISEKINKLNRCILIGVSGIPGAGKSTFSEELKKYLSKPQNLVNVIPFDGFHKYKSELTADQIIYRGRIDTFDLLKFKNKIEELKYFFNETPHGLNKNNNLNEQKNLFFPSFDHSIGDPIENDIEISNETNIVIIEGLYLFCKEVACLDYFDIKIFLQTDVAESMQRVAKRNYEAGISKSLEDSLNRTNINDKENALYVIKNLGQSEMININYIK
jgi:pantothenate kinase